MIQSEKLLVDFDKLWTFMRVSGMEPANNLAERDLKKLVIWRRKSYGTRSKRGRKFVERITSVAQTLRKHGANVLHFIQDAVVRFYRKDEAPNTCYLFTYRRRREVNMYQSFALIFFMVIDYNEYLYYYPLLIIKNYK